MVLYLWPHILFNNDDERFMMKMKGKERKFHFLNLIHIPSSSAWCIHASALAIALFSFFTCYNLVPNITCSYSYSLIRVKNVLLCAGVLFICVCKFSYAVFFNFHLCLMPFSRLIHHVCIIIIINCSCSHLFHFPLLFAVSI